MKKALILAGLMALSSGALGQGQINFSTINGVAWLGSVGAPSLKAGSTYKGQLYVSTGASFDPVTATAIGTPQSYISNPTTGLGTGIISGTTVNYGTPATQVWLQVRAWLGSAGTSYETALPSGMVGQSSAIQVTLGGGTLPPTSLAALTPFAIAVIPEPSTIALGLLGIAGLLIRRRK